MDDRKLLMVALASLAYHPIPITDPRALKGSDKMKKHSSRLRVKPKPNRV